MSTITSIDVANQAWATVALDVNSQLRAASVSQTTHLRECTMKTAVMMVSAVGIALAMTNVATGQMSSAEFQRRQRELRAQYQREAAERHARAVAEMKSRHEQRAAEMRAKHKRHTAEMNAEFQRHAAETRRRYEQRTRTLPFDPSAAPSPSYCLWMYVAAAKKAKSMDDIYGYLPHIEQPERWDAGRNRSSTFDTSALRKAADSANEPFASFAFRQHKRIAAKILQLLSVKIEGNKAVLIVSTSSGGIINGVEYPYGKAKVEMLGEGTFWKFDKYNDLHTVYMEPPQPKW